MTWSCIKSVLVQPRQFGGYSHLFNWKWLECNTLGIPLVLVILFFWRFDFNSLQSWTLIATLKEVNFLHMKEFMYFGSHQTAAFAGRKAASISITIFTFKDCVYLLKCGPYSIAPNKRDCNMDGRLSRQWKGIGVCAYYAERIHFTHCHLSGCCEKEMNWLP